MNTTHTVPTGTMAEAINRVIPTFTFDLLDWAESIDHDRIRESVLRGLAWSADGLIAATLGRMINEFYRNDMAQDEPQFESYAAMLRFLEGLEVNEQNLVEQGFEVTNTKQLITALVDIRQTCHLILAGDNHDRRLAVPTVQDMLANPRLRSTSQDTLVKNEQLAKLMADGDLDLEKELLAQFSVKDKMTAQRNLDFDRNRSKSLIMLFMSMNIDQDTPQDDPFRALDARHQYKLMQAAKRAVDRAVDDARQDNRVNALELASIYTDAKSLTKALVAELGHPRFDHVEA